MTLPLSALALTLVAATACNNANNCECDDDPTATETETETETEAPSDTDEPYVMPGTWTSDDPDTEETFKALHASSDRVWVAGDEGTSFVLSGSSWSDISEDLGGHDFTGMWGIDEELVVAVATGGTLATWDEGRSQWDVDEGEAEGDFDAIDGTATDRYFAVGWNLAWQWNGEDYEAETLPDNTRINDLFDAESYAFAVGEKGIILRRTASGTWSDMDSPITVNINAVDGNRASNIWAVGEDGFIISFDGSDWARQRPTNADGEPMTESSLNDVYVADNGDVFICGNRGTVIAWIDGEWEDLTAGIPRHYYAIGAADGAASPIYVAGGAGSVKHWVAGESSEDTAFDTER